MNQELRDAGIIHLSIFGSVARSEATALSDVDLIADFDKSNPFDAGQTRTFRESSD